MDLIEAPFQCELKIVEISGLGQETELVLRQLGIYPAENIEKLHVAPLGDPLTVRVGGQRFSLRKEICRGVKVSKA